MTTPTRRSSSIPTSSAAHNLSTTTHAPTTPSGLRESETIAISPVDEDNASSSHPSPNSDPTKLVDTDPAADDHAFDGRTHGTKDLARKVVDETTGLLQRPFEFLLSSPHEGPCGHGTFSPKAASIRSSDYGESPRAGEGSRGRFSSLLETVGMNNGGKKKLSTTSQLASQHGIKNTATMYFRKCPISLS